MKISLWNRPELRPRSGWRILAVFICFAVVMVFTGLVRKALGDGIVSSLMGLIVFAILTIGVLWFAARYIDRRAVRAFGFRFDRKWWLDFTFGFSLCVALFGAVFLLERSLGWVTIVEVFKNEKEAYKNLPFALTMVVAMFAYTARILWEELFFRGYLIKNLSEGFNNERLGRHGAASVAFALSSVLYGLIHSGNPHISLTGIVNLFVLGVFFGLPYLLTGELAIPIALHLSWNFFQGIVFGFPVSGQLDKVAVFSIDRSGPDLWTGGAFGPEGGLIGLLTMLAGCVIIVLWIWISRGHVSPHPSLPEYEPSQ